jgi:hypothetical protein
VLAGGYFYVRRGLEGTPIDYSTDSQSKAFDEQFRYGSIGSDAGGLPYHIWKVLPEVFPEFLPDKGAGGKDYSSFGALYEEGRDRPIGVAKREGFVDSVGLNCAVCHTGAVRESPNSPPKFISAMPAQQFDLGAYFNFLFACADDPRFTSDVIIKAIEAQGSVGFIEKLILPTAIGKTKEELQKQESALSFLKARPTMGPGRVDTFNPYKVLYFDANMQKDQTIGTVDFPAIWQQDIKKGLFMHWDGNNNSIDERNISASLGAGAKPETVDLTRVDRIRDWLMILPSAKYPFPIDDKLAQSGETVYKTNCAECHDPGGAKFGQVTPVADLKTDPKRVESFGGSFVNNSGQTKSMVDSMNSLGTGYAWKFTHFRVTNGYVNRPLDGIWARGPYLHNGSVPNLRALLETERPSEFYRGDDVFDPKNVGFVTTEAKSGTRDLFKYNTAEPGNNNTGHTYGAELTESDKVALLEYLKTK